MVAEPRPFTDPTHNMLNPMGIGCQCVADHSPSAYVGAQHHIVPQSWGGKTVMANMVWLCPNTHTAVHRLLDEYVRNKGLPPWDTRRKFSPYVRTLAAMAWTQRPANPTITSLEHH